MFLVFSTPTMRAVLQSGRSTSASAPHTGSSGTTLLPASTDGVVQMGQMTTISSLSILEQNHRFCVQKSSKNLRNHKIITFYIMFVDTSHTSNKPLGRSQHLQSDAFQCSKSLKSWTRARVSSKQSCCNLWLGWLEIRVWSAASNLWLGWHRGGNQFKLLCIFLNPSDFEIN